MLDLRFILLLIRYQTVFFSFQSETSTPGEGEERTPGRLHAVWPPLKEEKVGLKYTEAGSTDTLCVVFMYWSYRTI